MATSEYREAMCDALTYTATTSGSSSAGDVFYYTPDKNDGEYFMVTDWTSPDYWSKQKADKLRKGQKDYLLQQAKREEFHKYKRPEKTYTNAEMKAWTFDKMKAAYAKTKYKKPAVGATMSVAVYDEFHNMTRKLTPLQEMWRKADEWLSTVQMTTN
jgi:hypothetical protein